MSSDQDALTASNALERDQRRPWQTPIVELLPLAETEIGNNSNIDLANSFS